MCIIINLHSSYIAHVFRYLYPIFSLLLRDRRMRLSWLLIDTQFSCLRHKMLYSGSQKSEVCPMPTEAYALCPRRPMPSRTSSFARKAITLISDTDSSATKQPWLSSNILKF